MGSRVASVAVVLALVTCLGGAGGRTPLSALAWQSLAVIAVVAALFAQRRRRPASVLSLVGLGFVVLIALSAALGADPVAAGTQAAAWIASIGLGWALVVALEAEADRVGEEAAQRMREALMLGASGAALILEVATVVGHRLAGRGGVGEAIRPLGTFADPNHLTLLLLLIAAIHARWAGLRGRARLHLATVVLAATAALATRSRIAAIVIVALAGAEALRRGALGARRVMAALAVVIVLASGAMAWTLVSRRGEADSLTRPRIWRAAAPAVLERPLLGLGPAGFQHGWWPFNFPVERGIGRYEKIVTTPHGEWLRAPIELGLVGTGLACAFALSFIVRLRRRGEVLPLAGVLIPALAVHDIFHSAATGAWAAAAAALVLVEASRAPRAPGDAASLAGGDGRTLTAIAVAAALLIGWRVRETRAAMLLDEGLLMRDGARLERAIELAPRDVGALVSIAELLAPSGTLRVAQLRSDALLEEASRLAPRDPRPVSARARLATRAMHDLFADTATRARVSELHDAAVLRAPRDAFMRVEAAAVLLQASDAEAALRHASEAMALEPAMRRALALRVLALVDLGRQADAESARQALESHLEATANLSPDSIYQRQLLECEPEICERALAR
jgi:hypothetical protein